MKDQWYYASNAYWNMIYLESRGLHNPDEAYEDRKALLEMEISAFLNSFKDDEE